VPATRRCHPLLVRASAAARQTSLSLWGDSVAASEWRAEKRVFPRPAAARASPALADPRATSKPWRAVGRPKSEARSGQRAGTDPWIAAECSAMAMARPRPLIPFPSRKGVRSTYRVVWLTDSTAVPCSGAGIRSGESPCDPRAVLRGSGRLGRGAVDGPGAEESPLCSLSWGEGAPGSLSVVTAGPDRPFTPRAGLLEPGVGRAWGRAGRIGFRCTSEARGWVRLPDGGATGDCCWPRLVP
jgi:hypothetical protein